MKKLKLTKEGSPFTVIESGFSEKQLSALELSNMLGGACGSQMCKADGGCGANACGGQACGVVMCGVNGCGGDVCGGNICPVDMCPLDACLKDIAATR